MRGLARLLLGACLVCVGAGLHAQAVNVSQRVNNLVNDLIRFESVYCGEPGPAPNRQLALATYDSLRRVATVPELKALLKHPAPQTRCYAFQGLASHSHIDMMPLVMQVFTDEAKVEVITNVSVGEQTVADYCIEVLTLERLFPNEAKLTVQQRFLLDSMIVYRPNQLVSRYQTIRGFQVRPWHHPRFRELVLAGEVAALPNLGKFRDAADVPFILGLVAQHPDWRADIYSAMTEFPHPKFFPWLQQEWEATLPAPQYSSQWMFLYQAIAAYRDTAARDILLRAVDPETPIKQRSFHLRYALIAVAKFPDPHYNEVLFTLWEKHGYINLGIFQHLCRQDHARAMQDAKSTLESKKWLENFPDYSHSEYVDEEVLRRIMQDSLSVQGR
jgi:hypothetical protein